MADAADALERAREALGEAYQVIGAIARYAGFFETRDVQRALDNISAAADGEPVPHTDLLPFPKEGLRPTDAERLEDPPASVIARGVAMLNTPRSGPDETLVHDIWQAMLDELRALAEPSR